MQQPVQRLLVLDGLRGIAAIAVMLYHVGAVFGSQGLFARAYLFVDLFFLLSGFVLTLAAEQRMNAGWGTVGFMRARLVRLWPVIAAGTVIAALAKLFTGAPADMPLLIALAALMIPAWHRPGMLFPLNGPQWSLFHELVANLAHGLLLRRMSDIWLGVFVGFAGALLAMAISLEGANEFGPTTFSGLWAFTRVAFAYPLGVLLARLWRRGWRSRWLDWRGALVLPLALVVALTLLPVGKAAGDAIATIVILPALFWLAASAREPRTGIIWLERLGAISYPLYAVHLPVLKTVAAAANGWPAMVFAVLTTIMLAQAVAWLVSPKRRLRGPDEAKALTA